MPSFIKKKKKKKKQILLSESDRAGVGTITTNMAGSDIKFLSKSKVAGGLATVGTKRHDFRRQTAAIDSCKDVLNAKETLVGVIFFLNQLKMRLIGSSRIS